MSEMTLKSKPFIYISSLRRTGSTVLSESLTKMPYSFIFREPRIGQNRINIKSFDIDLFNEYGLDLGLLVENASTANSKMNYFANIITPRLLKAVQQVGVKEIRNKGWQSYVKAFPNIKFVITGRDPRDIYISLYYRLANGKSSWKGEFSPNSLANHLEEEIKYQSEIQATQDYIKLKYENFCSSQEEIKKVKKFLSNDISSEQRVGHFNKSNPNRIDEYLIHEDKVTTKSMYRWKNEKNKKVLEDSFRFFDLLSKYADEWGYD